jgi:hypothetical protein
MVVVVSTAKIEHRWREQREVKVRWGCSVLVGAVFCLGWTLQVTNNTGEITGEISN